MGDTSQNQIVKRKICVFTGTRAEYSCYVSPLVRTLKKDKELEVRLLVSGAHLSEYYGSTYKEIEGDGLLIDEGVHMLVDEGGGIIPIAKSMGLGLMGMTEALLRLNPHILVIIGDRYEAVCAAIAGTLCSLAIAHIAGGEETLGSMDNYWRHVITKLSHLHFTQTEQAKMRVIQMGEHPSRVFNVGSLSVEQIAQALARSKGSKD